MAMPIYFRYGTATLQTMSTIGGRIRALRNSLKMNQTQLGKLAGVDQSTISDIEKGASTNPEVFLAICDALETTPEHLVKGQERDDHGEAKVLSIYRALSLGQRANMIAMASSLKTVDAESASGELPTEEPQRKRSNA